MTTLKHTFTEPPPAGFELTDNGFRYVVVGSRPHRNLKGEPSAIVTWRGWCAHDGQSFEFKTGAKVYALARRCKAHNAGWAKAAPYDPRNAQPALRVTTADATPALPGMNDIDSAYLLDELNAKRDRIDEADNALALMDWLIQLVEDARDAEPFDPDALELAAEPTADDIFG